MICSFCNLELQTAGTCLRCGCLVEPAPSSASKARRRAFKLHALAHVLWLLVPLYFYGRLFGSDAYLTSLQLAKSSPAMQQLLGAGIHATGLPIGSALPRYGSDFAEWSVSLAGSSGAGRIYGVANKLNGVWEYSRLVFVAGKTGASVDLTPKPRPILLKRDTPKTIYLVPLDLAPAQTLDWAPAYYKAKFDADVQLLPPVAPTAREEDPKRHQLIAERCIDLISRSHRDLAADPTAILIGVTSRDMFIAAFDWRYAENFRARHRFAMVSSARLEPTGFPGKWNKELLNSRLKKMITKNVAILYLNLPLIPDYTSLLSSGDLSGQEVDYMTEQIVGAKNLRDSIFYTGDPMVTLTIKQGKPATWSFGDGAAVSDLATEQFSTDLSMGLLMQQKTDFYLDDPYPLEFRRVYRNHDDASRAFGVGGSNSLEIFLVGRMESYVDLVGAEGGRSHFVYAGRAQGNTAELYRPQNGPYKEAVYADGVWRVTSQNGWIYLFPYCPKAAGAHVTVLTGMIDPDGRKTGMVRNDAGDLLSVTTPSGKWLHFDYDGGHRLRRIQDSLGRSVEYEYGPSGRLIRTRDSEGHSEQYSYNDRGAMRSAAFDNDTPMLVNEYSPDNDLRAQVLSDGRRFEYSYSFLGGRIIQNSLFTEPIGLSTFFTYQGRGYYQSLPTRIPR